MTALPQTQHKSGEIHQQELALGGARQAPNGLGSLLGEFMLFDRLNVTPCEQWVHVEVL
jgi:hypothetical protein